MNILRRLAVVLLLTTLSGAAWSDVAIPITPLGTTLTVSEPDPNAQLTQGELNQLPATLSRYPADQLSLLKSIQVSAGDNNSMGAAPVGGIAIVLAHSRKPFAFDTLIPFGMGRL